MKDNEIMKLRSTKFTKIMNMVGSNMVEVNDMDTVDKHFHLMNHRPEVEVMDMVEEYFHPMNHRLEVEGMDMVNTDMGRIERLSWRWLKESLMAWCWRGIAELIESGRSL
jgi:hypothetical protein